MEERNLPGYTVHIATAKEYLRKKNRKINEDFIQGSIAPDFTNDKSKTHYGKSPAYTNLKNYLLKNEINSNFQEGYFLHLVTDYLFYNYYLDYLEKPQIYNDYDYTNKSIIEKYNLTVPENIKDKIFFKEGIPKILTLKLAYKVIDEISNMDLEEIKKEVLEDNKKWSSYKNIV